jgi:hypothetical protein
MPGKHRPVNEVLENPKLTVSFGFALVLYLVLIILMVIWWNSSIALSAVLGSATGWVAGILLAPYDGENTNFKRYSKAVGGFISGFLLAKFDKIFDLVTDKTTGIRLTDTVVQRTCGVYLAFFLITSTIVFVARSYWQAGDEEDER